MTARRAHVEEIQRMVATHNKKRSMNQISAARQTEIVHQISAINVVCVSESCRKVMRLVDYSSHEPFRAASHSTCGENQ